MRGCLKSVGKNHFMNLSKLLAELLSRQFQSIPKQCQQVILILISFKCVGWLDLVHDRRHRLRNRSIRGRSVNTIPHTVYHAAQCALDRLTDYIRRKQAQPPPPTPPQAIPESIQRRKKTSTISKFSTYLCCISYALYNLHYSSCTKINLHLQNTHENVGASPESRFENWHNQSESAKSEAKERELQQLWSGKIQSNWSLN